MAASVIRVSAQAHIRLVSDIPIPTNLIDNLIVQQIEITKIQLPEDEHESEEASFDTETQYDSSSKRQLIFLCMQYSTTIKRSYNNTSRLRL